MWVNSMWSYQTISHHYQYFSFSLGHDRMPPLMQVSFLEAMILNLSVMVPCVFWFWNNVLSIYSGICWAIFWLFVLEQLYHVGHIHNLIAWELQHNYSFCSNIPVKIYHHHLIFDIVSLDVYAWLILDLYPNIYIYTSIFLMQGCNHFVC